MKTAVLVAGIGGASLGTELAKCLGASGSYSVYGCDVSPYAFGHYRGFERTFLVSRTNYIDSVLDLCKEHRIGFVVPGAEEPNILLVSARSRFEHAGVCVASNAPALVRRFSDKAETFSVLHSMGFLTPRTIVASDDASIGSMQFPCVVKPSTGTGGSALVFLATDREEAVLCVDYVRRAGRNAILQEYIPADEGEFTVGVLSYSDGAVGASIALRRLLENKLSVTQQVMSGVISSGYSQGLIDEFPAVRAQAEAIASRVGSTGPLNIQGRVRDGKLIPFEINPRFSASAYLRAMAGVNEVDLYIRNALTGERPGVQILRTGYYLRSFTEVFVETSDLIHS